MEDATVIGDPPNIIIVNDKRIAGTGEVNFVNFMLHVAPGVILTVIASFFYMRFIFRQVKREPSPLIEKEIQIWKKTVHKIKGENDEEKIVASKLLHYIESLEHKKS